jgi:hypothetical protein
LTADRLARYEHFFARAALLDIDRGARAIAIVSAFAPELNVRGAPLT